MQEIDWALMIFLFFSNIADDALATLGVLWISERREVRAAVLTIGLTLLVAFSIRSYATNFWYVIPIAFGSGLGCLAGIRTDKWLKRRKRGKRKQAEQKVKNTKRRRKKWEQLELSLHEKNTNEGAEVSSISTAKDMGSKE